MAAEIIMRLERVGRAYKEADRELVILKDADFTLRRGEMVALVAPSGAGKSTLLHTAGLLERPDNGDVFLDGRSCSKLSMMSARLCAATTSVSFISSTIFCRNFPRWRM